MADVLVKPAFQSAYADTGDPTKLGPTSWNAPRLFSGGADGQVVARSAASPTGAVWVSPSTPGVHALTHQPGGTDPLTALSAAILTTGTLPDARLSANVQMKPIALADLPASVATKPIPQSDVVNLVSDLALKAPIASPTLTGVPKAPTASAGTSTTQLATTAFVQGELATAVATPSAHHVSHEPGGSDALTVDAAPATGSLRTLGTGANQAAPGNDARLTDQRVPQTHHATHEPGGADALVALDAAVLTTGTLANARLAADVVVTSSVSIGPTPAGAGALRLANSGWIVARTAANDADITLVATDGSNNVGFVHLSNNAIYVGAGSNTLNLRVTRTNFSGVIAPDATDVYDVGFATLKWRDAYFSGVVTALGGLGATPLNATYLTSGTMPKARIQMTAGKRLLGSSSTGAGAMEEITLGSGLDMAGNQLYLTSVGGGAGGPHATSHQPGGNDPITALAAETLTSGTLNDARLTVNVLRYAGGYPGGTTTFLRADGVFTTLPPTLDLKYLGDYTTPRTYKDGEIVIAADGVAYMCVVDGTTTPPEPWPAATVSTAHHLTHEPGGNDQILNLGYITIHSTMVLHEAANAVDQRDWGLDSRSNTTFTIRPELDGGMGGTGVEFVFTRAGAFTAPAGLATTPLNASNLTSGSIPGARLPSNVALKDAANIFSVVGGAGPMNHSISIQAVAPIFSMLETGAPANSKWWRQFVSGQIFYMAATNDAETSNSGVLTMDRSGNVAISGSLNVNGSGASGNVALKNAVNTFTGVAGDGQAKQYISGPAARLMLVNTSDPVDQKRWIVGTYGQILYLMALSDDELTSQGSVRINRAGTLIAGGNVVAVSMVHIGGSTAGFPGLRRSSVGVGIDCVTATQSDWGDLQCREFRTNGHLYQNQNAFVYPGSYSGYAAYQAGQYLATHSSYGLYSNTGLYLSYHFKQALGTFMYPGDLGNAVNGQGSYYLASHPSYGLYSNTSAYFAGGIFVGQGVLYNYANGGHFYVLNAAQNGWLDTVTIDGSNRMTLFGNGISMRIASPALGGAIGAGTPSTQSVYVYVDGVGQVRIPVYA